MKDAMAMEKLEIIYSPDLACLDFNKIPDLMNLYLEHVFN